MGELSKNMTTPVTMIQASRRLTVRPKPVLSEVVMVLPFCSKN